MGIKLPLKERFELPEGLVYLDGNSLGPLVKGVSDHVGEVVNAQWGQQLIRGWNDAEWMAQPARVADKIAELIGSAPGSVMMGDTLSIKVFQALAASLDMRPGRRVILSDTGNFPTDLYMAEGLIAALDRGYELQLVEPGAVAQSINNEVAVVMLTHVDYRTGQLHDMETITRLTHEAGAISMWDLAHSAGALPLNMAELDCEFAVGCTYKYLNGGPGAPAFIYIRPDLIDSCRPVLSGWMGHKAPFAFDQEYTAAQSIERMRVGTPPVIQLSVLEAALNVWQGVDINDVRAASVRLSELFIRQVEAHCPDLKLVSPRDPNKRGSQVSFAFDHGYAVMQALIEQGVIGDFRAPDIIRFGFTPLYLDEHDVLAAASVLSDVMQKRQWADPRFQVVNAVT